MFGRDWEPAQATIVAQKEIRSFGGDKLGKHIRAFEYVADVQPASGGPAFRCVMHEPFDERVWRHPAVGDVVPALCKPKKQEAKFDTDTVTAEKNARDQAAKAQDAAQFDAMLQAPAGTPPAGSAAPPAAGASPDAEFQRMYDEEVEELRRRGE